MGYDEFLSRYSNPVQEVCQRLREIIKGTFPDIHERVYPGYKTISYGMDGSGRYMEAEICYLSPLRDSVNLGFYRGTALSDPNRMLTGTGKMMRHTKFRSLVDIDEAKVVQLLEEIKSTRVHQLA